MFQVACKELRNSRLFLKLLEAVLKTGNRMNDGTFRGGARAFKLDTLLKLSDVRGTDGKTTLLHFVVQEIIRSEGTRAVRAAGEATSMVSEEERSADVEEQRRSSMGLEAVANLSCELAGVKKAAAIDADSLMGTIVKLRASLQKTRDFLEKDLRGLEEENGFHRTLTSFVQNAEVDVTWLAEEEKRIMALVKSTGHYFHGNSGRDEGLRLFLIVRDFLMILDKVCREVREAQKKHVKMHKNESSLSSSSPSPRLLHSHLFPSLVSHQKHDSSSSSDADPSGEI